jgi:Competence protein
MSHALPSSDSTFAPASAGSRHSPVRAATTIQNSLAGGLAITFHAPELLALTLVLQLGMLPLMAANFHRIALSSPVVNLVAVPVTGIVVPWGFLTLTAALIWPLLGRLLAAPLALLTAFLIRTVEWFAALPHWSYRIPKPPLWLTILFFALAIAIATIARTPRSRVRATDSRCERCREH